MSTGFGAGRPLLAGGAATANGDANNGPNAIARASNLTARKQSLRDVPEPVKLLTLFEPPKPW
jgi:hypothetical protein